MAPLPLVSKKVVRSVQFFSVFITIIILILFLCLSSISAIPFTSSSSSTTIREADALLKWKDSLENPTSHSFLHSWKKLLPSYNSTSPPFTNSSRYYYPKSRGAGDNSSCCKWIGIVCNELGSVVEINLTSSNLRGTLRNFDFSSLPNLLTFVLYNNSLHGSIPSHISNLSRLTHLDLGRNQLSGNIPSEIGLLTSLRAFHVGRNYLINGSIPLEIGRLVFLEEFSCNSKSLSGSIPPSIGNLSKLFTLDLSENNITGSVPKSIGNLRSLTSIRLFLNSITGSVSLEMNNHTDMEYLHISYNSLSGYLPENICLGGRLKWFVASDNHFTGSIPKSLRNCSSLLKVSLQRNQLTGNISEEFGKYSNLVYMDLSNNKFVGELTRNWGQCPELTKLSISDNRISGRIPTELGKATQLQVLDLSSNVLVGNIPKELGGLKLLFSLKLNNNSLSTKFPTELGMLSELEQLDLSSSKLSGPIPIELEQCSKLRQLNLRNNMLSGTVPFQLGRLQSLENLDLSDNLLTGELPSGLAVLDMLETLNLSHNKLWGSIPSSFGDMISVTFIDVSNNELEGSLPNSKAFRGAATEAFKNNKGLCGTNSTLNPRLLSEEDSNEPSKHSKLTVEALYIFILSGSVTCIILFFIIVGVLYIRKKRERNNNEEPRVTPNETFFVAWRYDGKKVYKEMVAATENFDFKYCIGVGGYGSVYKTKLSTGQVFAMKKFHENGGVAGEEAFKSESSILTRVRHRNIIKLYGFCLHTRHSFLVYEFMTRGSLTKILRDNVKAMNLEWSKRANVVKGLADALSYMHHECCPRIVHRDIASKNILLDGEYEARISDFGSAIIVDPAGSSNWISFAGTFGYVAPELAYTMEANEKSDVYSYGVVTLEVIMGKHPGDFLSSLLTSSSSSSSPASHEHILLTDVLDQRLSPPTIQIADKVVTMAKLAFACLHPSPQCRPTMKQVSEKLSTSSPLMSLPDDQPPLDTITLKQLFDP